jgi:protein-arginine kinase activator protein McsA/ketosteroid isomerase-like protein
MAAASGMLAAAVRPHAFATTCFDCQFKEQSSSSSIAAADVFFAAAAAQQQQQKETTSSVLRFGSSSCRLLVRTPLPSLSFFAAMKAVNRRHNHLRAPHPRCDVNGGADVCMEGKVQILEAELQAAIESEDYEVAASLRDELRVLQENDEVAVTAANEKFYRAFAQGDIKLMYKVWANGDHVRCIHPGASCISGFELVMSSWELLLGGDVEMPLRIKLENLEVYVRGDLAFVSCTEIVRAKGSRWGSQVATNIFEKRDGKWLLCCHHASHTKR